MEVACTPPCGTLTVNVFNAASAVLSGASVSIVNSGTSPAININTFTNESGVVSFIGAPAASGYQIVVSKTGYSTDQTYTTPPEQHITVSNNATAVRTSRIDVLGQKTIKTWTQILLAAWTDTFADSSKIASSATTTIAGGVAHLTGSSGTYPPTGDFQSISIAPSSLNKWKTFSAATSTPLATAVLFRFYDGTGTTLIPDSAIPGNSTGIATSTVSLLGVSTTTYPSMRVGTTLTSGDSSVTPSVDSYSVAYDYGPTPLPSLAFSMIGAKVISNGPPTVYKYNSALSSGAGASLALSNVEYDTYTIVVDAATTGYDVAAVCQPQSEYGAIGSPTTQFVFAPAAQTQTDIFLAAHTANSLLVDVRSAATGALVTNASVRLYKTGYDTTVTDGTCGQAFFGGLASGTYSVEVSASGYTTYTSSAVSVSETGRLSVTLD